MPGGWYGLLAILQQQKANEDRERDLKANPLACPIDGWPLTAGPDGQPFCVFDGWHP